MRALLSGFAAFGLAALLAAACSRPSPDPPAPPPAVVETAPSVSATASAEPSSAALPDAALSDAAPADAEPSSAALDAAAPDASPPVVHHAYVPIGPGGPVVIDVGLIDDAANGAVARGEVAGAVIAAVQGGRLVFEKAYGLRSKEPEEKPMTVDTVFDLASLTKVVATAPSIMLLVEQGKLHLGDPVVRYLPSFGKNGKDRITVEQLLLHTAGLIADNSILDYKGGPADALARIDALAPVSEPGEKVSYSDVGFIVLGELVEKISGEPLDVFSRKHFYDPLGMRDTAFNPDAALAARAAPTEPRDGVMLQGEVHDPRAHALGGVAGHAGLFSTAADLGEFVAMLLAGGRHGDKQILAPLTLLRMTEPHDFPSGARRTLGWDVRPGFSGAGGYGHTGFTGTSLWIDPGSGTGLVVLTSRLHPDGKGDVSRLRREVAAAVARSREAAAVASVPVPAPVPAVTAIAPVAPKAAPGAVLTGLDVLEQEGFAVLRGRKVGLITNQTGVDRAGRSVVDVLRAAEGVTLVALFTPEHGLRGLADAQVPDGRDARTGLPVYSLYGAHNRPRAEQLAGLDTLVFDLQDAGARFYTYPTTLGYMMEAAAEHHLRMVVLDRPNPIGGVAVEGPVLEAGRSSFTEYHPLPLRHGMTVGELAQLFNAERKIGADLVVVRLQGYHRDQTFDRTGLAWINPSPNLRSVDEALLYPGVALLELTNVSVGRGTDRPFEQVGAPWIDAARFATALSDLHLPGVLVTETTFTPTSGTHAGVACPGARLQVTDRARVESARVGIGIALTLGRLYRAEWDASGMRRMLGHQPTFNAVVRGEPLGAIVSSWVPDLDAFLPVRKKYLLYAP